MNKKICQLSVKLTDGQLRAIEAQAVLERKSSPEVIRAMIDELATRQAEFSSILNDATNSMTRTNVSC